jgi:type VI secretion system secreted protein Hcp
MAVDMFLKLDGIKGESVDHKHKDEIEVLSWSWGVTQTGTTHSGTGGGAGKANVHDITITKFLDKATPALLQHCLQGVHVNNGVLTVRKAGGKNPLEYVKFKISDALVSSVQTGGTGHDERLTETLALNFGKLEFEYVPQKADGTGDASTPIQWNIATHSEK